MLEQGSSDRPVKGLNPGRELGSTTRRIPVHLMEMIDWQCHQRLAKRQGRPDGHKAIIRAIERLVNSGDLPQRPANRGTGRIASRTEAGNTRRRNGLFIPSQGKFRQNIPEPEVVDPDCIKQITQRTRIRVEVLSQE